MNCKSTDYNRLRSDDFSYSNYTFLNSNEETMMEAIADYPVLSSIRVMDSFFNYTGGIISCDPKETPKIAQYDVQVIGYSKKDRYYIIKNSMGTGWGEKGFARISMDNDCGITRSANSLISVFEQSWLVEKPDIPEEPTPLWGTRSYYLISLMFFLLFTTN